MTRALADKYVGVSGQATVDEAVGFNLLVGGSNRTTELQPLSAIDGSQFAVGLTNLELV
jgi:hypothetical protein